VAKRIITALILLALFLPALFWAPGLIWALLAAAALDVAGYEWGHLAAFPPPLSLAYGGLLFACALVLYLADQPQYQHALLVLSTLFWALVAPLWLIRRWLVRSPFILSMTGLIVLLPTWVALIKLRELGPLYLLGLLTVAWIADSVAYFAGKAYGKHKLAPSISPGKTWEGIAGAGVALVLYASVVSAAIAGLHIVGALCLVLSLFYLSILGDLFESWMKRSAGIKDSGTFLPGHGGILDRIDALTAVLPVGATILMLAGAR
jgi:phosphatidate cytidylyltransferase